MAASQLQLEFGLTCPALAADLPSISATRRIRDLVPEIGNLEALFGGEERMPPGDLQVSSWQDFFGEPALWWDNKRNPGPCDVRYKFSQLPERVDGRPKTAWVGLQTAALDGGMKTPPEPVSPSVEGQGAVKKLGALERPLEIGMCRKLCESGRISDAVDALNLWVQQGCHVHTDLFYIVLKRCIAHYNLVMGSRIHALIIKSGHEGDAFLATHLISLYGAHAMLEEALQVFTRVRVPTVYNWTAIIFAYARHGKAARAVRLYRQMLESATVKPDNRLYVAVLKACASAGDLVAGKEVHAHILSIPGKPDVFVQAGLVSMYAKCGSLGDARSVFDRFPEKDIVTWTALIAGYSQQGMGEEALSLYTIMQQEGLTPPDSVTYVCLLQACSTVGVRALDQARQLHAEIEQRGLQEDLVLGGSLVNMYAKCGSLGDARRVFDRLPKRNVVTWTALIAGYTQQGMCQDALSLYICMRQECLTAPDSVTYLCLLQACAGVGVGAVEQGKQIHAEIEKQGLQGDVVLGGTLVNMYAKCGSLGDARRLFDRLPEKDVVAWTALIAGYAEQAMGEEALNLYSAMQHEGLNPPDSVTYVCLLQACASVGEKALDQGKQLHAQVDERGLQEDVVLGGSLVNMYAKCGCLGDACRVFDGLPERNVVAWNALLAGYAQQGMDLEALSLYNRMQQESGTAPDSVTFVCLLQACASVAVLPLGQHVHAQIEERGLQGNAAVGVGLVNMYAKCGSMFDSQQLFELLPERSIEAWNALISGYACQGDSDVVFDLVGRMRLEGIQPDAITFVCLLTVCSHVGQVDKGLKFFEAMKLDYGISPSMEHYTCMMDLLGRAGHLEEALQMAKTMPFPPNGIVWHTLLGACKKWKNVEIGKQALEFAVTNDEQDTASYVLMSNNYAKCCSDVGGCKWDACKENQM